MRLPRSEIIFLISIFFLATILLVGSSESRLANSNGDDHPVVWARYFTHPQNWTNDSNLVGAKAFGRASLPNLLAIMSTKIHEAGPYVLSWLYVLIQNVGLGLALYFFSRSFIKDSRTAVIVSLLTFFMCPWQLNLAYYPNLMHSPYPGHLVMPFIVLAAYCIFSERFLTGALILAIGGMIHPSQTIQFVFIGALFLFLTQERKTALKRCLMFLIPMATSIAVPLFFVPKFPNPLSDQDLLPSALLNPHLVPWNSTTFWPWGFPSLVSAFFLSSLECRPFSKEPSKLKSFWWSNLIGLTVLGTLHVLGAHFRILPMVLFCPFRVSVINSVLLAPIGFYHLLKKSIQSNWTVGWTATSLLMFLLLSKSGFFWGLYLILFLFDNDRWLKKQSRLFSFLIVGWWLLYLGVGRPVRSLFGPETSALLRLFLSPGFSLTNTKLFASIVLSLLLVLIIQRIKSRKSVLINFLVLWVGVFGLIQSYQQGQLALTGELKSVWDMQKWAKQSSPSNAVFLFEGGSWRGVSERQVQVVGYRKNQILGYFRYREAKEAENKLIKLYARYGVQDYNKLPDSGFLIFAKEFKGTHLIESAKRPTRSFKVAYENEGWRIYELPKIN